MVLLHTIARESGSIAWVWMRSGIGNWWPSCSGRGRPVVALWRSLSSSSRRPTHGLTPVAVAELIRVPGVGRAKAAQVLAAVELGRRTLTRAPAVKVQFGCPRDVAAYLTPRFGGGAVERFGVVLLDTKHRVVKATVLSVGTLDASLVHPREVFREATTAGAAAVVLFHNHPSGDPTPSRDDIALTSRLVEAGELMGIAVLDHVVLGESRYFSFKESGRL